MTKILTILLAIAIATPAIAARKKKKKQMPTMKPDKEVVYKKTPQCELKLHIFNPEGHKTGDSNPCIVFFFGGGWNGGSPSQFYPHCKYLASRGMVGMAAEYRVKSRNNTTPKECVKDGKSAVRWIRAHANDLGIDPNKVAAGGGSAGGHVAAATANTTAFEEESEDKSISSIPNALVLFNPVYDNGPDGWGHSRVEDYWKDISPLHNLSPKSPPTIVFLGSQDKLVPVATAEKYRDTMKKFGVRSELFVYEGQPHGFFNFGRDGGKWYYKTVLEADKFLASLGYLSGPPTLENPEK